MAGRKRKAGCEPKTGLAEPVALVRNVLSVAGQPGKVNEF